jgi:hypothetical protein
MGQKRDPMNRSLFLYPVQFMLIIQQTFSAHLPPLEAITEAHINKIFIQLGPVPHLCIDQTSDEQAEYMSTLYQMVLKDHNG